jgi:hypothetical protein
MGKCGILEKGMKILSYSESLIFLKSFNRMGENATEF